ncbi:hypothetical protein SUDANB150_06836 [Streptomyces sp. enrichment culture]
MRTLILRKSQSPRERGHHLRGRLRAPALLQLVVVVNRNAGQDGNLVAAQPRHPASYRLREPHFAGADAITSRPQELTEGSQIHTGHSGTTRRAKAGDAVTTLSAL